MFSQVCVCLSTGGRAWQSSVGGRGSVHGGGHVWWRVCVTEGHAWHASPPADTTRYGQWAGSTHPTGMQSCCAEFSTILNYTYAKRVIRGYGLAPGWERSQIYGPRVMNFMPMRVQWSPRNALVLVYGLGDHISPQLNMTTFTLLPPIFIVMFSAIAHQTCSPRNWSLRMGVLHNRTFLTLL